MKASNFLHALTIIVFLADDHLLPDPVFHPYKWWIAFFFVALSISQQMFFKKWEKEKNIIILYLKISLSRLLLSIGFIFLFLLRGLPDKRSFVFLFLGLYLLHMGFEVFMLLKSKKNQ